MAPIRLLQLLACLAAVALCGVGVKVLGVDWVYRKGRRSFRETLLGSNPAEDGTNRKTLEEILREAKSDRVNRHGYHRYYEKALAPFREMEGLRLLEIGVLRGQTLQAWAEYFQRPARIFSAAYGTKANVEAAKRQVCEYNNALCSLVNIHRTNQSDPGDLARLVRAADADDVGGTGFDIIIDDGSHVPMHQLTSFKHLFPHIRPGGLYVVEGVETSYRSVRSTLHGTEFGPAGVGASPVVSAVEKFKQLVDVTMRKHFSYPEYTVFGEEVDKDVAEVRFGDGLIFIIKKPADAAWDQLPDQSKNTALEGGTSRDMAAAGVEAMLQRIAMEPPIP